jgi:thymidylate kinase
MGHIPIYNLDLTGKDDRKSGLIPKLEDPVLARALQERRKHLRQPISREPYNFLKDTTRGARVIIVEGISGSGKDTVQSYLKQLIKGRDIYDYSEGEVLQSWNQLQIAGVSKVRVRFMKLFANYIKDIIYRDENAVFLLNRFHLSAYTMTILQNPKLEKGYNEIIDILRTLPVHIVILYMDENEIETRSLHPERSGAWHKFQQQIVQREGFRDRLERYVWQQRIILEAAERQQLPYSVIKLNSHSKVETEKVYASETQEYSQRQVHIHAANKKTSRKNPGVPQTL